MRFFPIVKAFTALTWYGILDDSIRRDKPRRGDRIVAQGVSPGYMSSHLKAPEGRKKSPILEVSVAPPGLASVGFVTQGLRPGLQFCRPSGTGLQHGLKPILPSGLQVFRPSGLLLCVRPRYFARNSAGHPGLKHGDPHTPVNLRPFQNQRGPTPMHIGKRHNR